MAEELDTLVLKIRADTAALARDAADMKAQFDAAAGDMGETLRRNLNFDLLKVGADSAMRGLEDALDRLIRKGKLGLEDIKALVRSILADMARALFREVTGRGGGGGGGGASGLVGLIGQGLQLFGLSGRASGGPVSEGRPYLVGERGPEVFVPEQAGRITPAWQGGAARVVNISINVAAPPNASPQMMQMSARQVARAVRRAMDEA
ncbi:phage tail tape measure C-terminal domain-containing protein [Pedomonas sp. V897]|uniref:phage tail tape measure C-terminal domain-containing protein n=1 Tax=Pedomonas sp. V897 TaxID=3446482 RepID=UPI003EE21CA8